MKTNYSCNEAYSFRRKPALLFVTYTIPSISTQEMYYGTLWMSNNHQLQENVISLFVQFKQ